MDARRHRIEPESSKGPTVGDLRLAFASPQAAHLDASISVWACGVKGALVALEAAGEHCSALLTRHEEERLAATGPRRRRAFLAGRVALKILGAKWGHVPPDRSARDVETTRPERPEPRCGEGPGSPAGCSLTHDSRFAVAVAADRPLGVDMEEAAPRLRRIARGFASPGERRLAEGSSLGDLAALARVFTLKEAVVKATSGELFPTLAEVEVLDLGEGESRFSFRGGLFMARHAVVGGHVLTLLVSDG